MMRVDKILSEKGILSRSQSKEYARKKLILVNGQPIKSTSIKINIYRDILMVEGKIINYSKYEYYMLNKPAGVVSATEDKREKTVMDLITTSEREGLFPVGRLDKDTVGLLIITNDGKMAHNLLSPSKHIPKTYYARVDGVVNDEDVKIFAEGMTIDGDEKLKPACLEILKSDDISEVNLTISEGKFHQVKRMFMAVDKKVIYLKRLAMGRLVLDDSLPEGEFRELSSAEIEILKGMN